MMVPPPFLLFGVQFQLISVDRKVQRCKTHNISLIRSAVLIQMKVARSYIERVVHHATKELLEEEMAKIDFIFINMCQILR